MLKKLKDGLRLRRGLGLVWSGGPNWVVVSLVLAVFISVLPVLGLYLQKLFFDEFANSFIEGGGIAVTVLVWLVIGMALVEISTHLFQSASNYVTTAQGESLKDFVMGKLHQKSIELDLSFYETPSYFDSLHVAQTEAPTRTATFVQVLSSISRDVLSLVTILGLLVTYHWAFALILFIAVVPGLFVHVKSSETLFKWQKKAAGRERETGYYHDLITQAAAAKESRVFGFGPVFAGWYGVIRSQLRKELLKITYWKQTRSFVVNACSIAALYVSFFYFAKETANGTYTLGDMSLFYVAFNRAQALLRQLVAGVTGLYESNLFIGNLFEVLDRKPTIDTKDESFKELPARASRIAFENVAFSYPGTPREAIADISLTIEPGEHIAIVGKNGSGKSTFVKLICRLYDRTSGNITFGGVDIRDFDPHLYRKRFSVLFQDHLQFAVSVKKNIRLGNYDTDDDERIFDSAKYSGADEVVQRLPNGYDTNLGKILNEGEQLSQGEWQKVALARALYRSAEITILDEPTSWMDPESEQEFFEKFHRISKGRTAIMISHRLSTVTMVDRIVVMERGRILEIGNHSELMEKRGRYFELFEMQAKGYLPTNTETPPKS